MYKIYIAYIQYYFYSVSMEYLTDGLSEKRISTY